MLRRLVIAPLTALVAASSLAGCTGDSKPEPAPSASPLSQIDLSGLTVARTSFCDSVDEGGVADVLGGEPRRTGHYSAGDRRLVQPGVRDIVNEYGCSFTRGARTARAWVFAQPVAARQARPLMAERTRTRGCTKTGELRFGQPGLVQTCRDRTSTRVTMAGLFGDAWLTCEVAGPAGRRPSADEVEAAQRWCAGVASAAAAS